MDFIEELTWRGMVHTMMPGTEEQLRKEMTTAYLGIDPTADSLHIGHLCGVMMLRHFQRCGHKPIALIGGATGMIGDPSGKSAERNLLDEDTLRHNQEAIKKQLAKFLDFESDAPNPVSLAMLAHKDFSLAPLLAGICSRIAGAFPVTDADAVHAEYHRRLWRADGMPHTFALPDGTRFDAVIEKVAPGGQLSLLTSPGAESCTFLFKEVSFVL